LNDLAKIGQKDLTRAQQSLTDYVAGPLIKKENVAGILDCGRKKKSPPGSKGGRRYISRRIVEP